MYRKLFGVWLGIGLPLFLSAAPAAELDSMFDSRKISTVCPDSCRGESAVWSSRSWCRDSLGLDVAAPPRKRPWLSGVEVVGTNLLFHVITRYIIHEDYAQITWSSIKNNFKTGFLWDNDKFNTNLFFHPYQGGLYYNCARSNGLNFWESAPYALFGSSIWELFLELQPPSTNDIISTTLGGMAMGEVSHRLSSLVLNGQARGWKRFGHEAIGLIINPVRGVNRLITGEAWRMGPRYVDQTATVPFYFQFDAGYRVLNCLDAEPDRSRHMSLSNISRPVCRSICFPGSRPSAKPIYVLRYGVESTIIKVETNCLPVFSKTTITMIARVSQKIRSTPLFASPRRCRMVPVYCIDLNGRTAICCS